MVLRMKLQIDDYSSAKQAIESADAEHAFFERISGVNRVVSGKVIETVEYGDDFCDFHMEDNTAWSILLEDGSLQCRLKEGVPSTPGKDVAGLNKEVIVKFGNEIHTWRRSELLKCRIGKRCQFIFYTHSAVYLYVNSLDIIAFYRAVILDTGREILYWCEVA